MKGEVAILGGGPIGLTCALLLARAGIASIVIDARTIDQMLPDQRLLAVSRGSWQILAPVLGSDVPRSAAILDVVVTSAGEFGTTRISAADFGGGQLGATVFYGDLVGALGRAAECTPLVESMRPRRVLDVEQTQRGVRARCDDALVVEAPFAIDAEGWSADASTKEPPQETVDAALVGDVTVQGPDAGCAFERFTREGPLALLPTPAGAAPLFSLVWCMRRSDATRRLAMAGGARQRELQAALGTRIGRVERVETLRLVPLHESARSTITRHRVVSIGNAAQTLHPVAGQGLNLGLRDCVTLVDCLNAGREAEALSQYQQRRSADRAVIGSITHWLPPLFATRFAPIAAARALGLTVLDLVPSLRRELAHVLMFGVRQ